MFYYYIQLLDAILECIQVTLSSGTVEALAELFNNPERGSVINSKLKPLIGQVRNHKKIQIKYHYNVYNKHEFITVLMLFQIITNKLESWKEAAVLNRVALPHLLDFDWTVHFQRASSEVILYFIFLFYGSGCCVCIDVV